jgi:hypothetical protein
MSSDDNNRLLWLDFGDSMEIVSIRSYKLNINIIFMLKDN